MLGKVMSKSELTVYRACRDAVRAVEKSAPAIGVDLIEGSIISESGGDAYFSFKSTLNGVTKYAMHKIDVFDLISLPVYSLHSHMDDVAGRIVNAIYKQHHNDNRIPQDETQHK